MLAIAYTSFAFCARSIFNKQKNLEPDQTKLQETIQKLLINNETKLPQHIKALFEEEQNCKSPKTSISKPSSGSLRSSTLSSQDIIKINAVT